VLLIINIVDGRFLSCWSSGGSHKTLEPPCMPHFWSYEPRKRSSPMNRRLLSDISKYTILHKVEADNTRDIPYMRDDQSLEADIPFIQLLTILYGFTQKDQDASVAGWDIEIIGRGQFPSPLRDPISTLSWFSPNHEEVLTGDERSIIEGFVDLTKRDNPDIEATYNGPKFDWRYIIKRAKILGVPLPIGRDGRPPWISQFEQRYGKLRGIEYTAFITGRISLDVWREVRMDTSLSGRVPNRQLKTVARYFFPDEEFIEVDRANLHRLSKEELREYSASDARATYKLAESYLMILKFLAQHIGCPLNLIVRRTPSHIGNLVYGREFKRMDVVSDGVNGKRFEFLWEEEGVG